MAGRAWLLNLDADVELGQLHGYTPRRQVERQVERHLVYCEALTLGEPVYGRDCFDPGLPVFCWCPTPSALDTLDKRGLVAVRGPGSDALRCANDRAWTVEFADPQLGRCFISSLDDWRRLLLEERSPTGSWRLKRRFGFAGRGQRRLRAEPSADDLRWVAASLGAGGLLREVELSVHEEFSIHGYVDPGELLLGSVVRFTTDAFGAPTGQGAIVLGRQDLARSLEQAATTVASHLVRLGYFGPFGLDAFSWRSARGTALNPVSDVNARFTLAWATGMGKLRERALQRYGERSSEIASASAQ